MFHNSKPQSKEKIYVVVAKKVRNSVGGYYRISCGKAAAQTAHVVSLLRARFPHLFGTIPITTIVLSCRSSEELEQLVHYFMLNKHSVELFVDEIEDGMVGMTFKAATAFAVAGDIAPNLLKHLPLWDCNENF